MPIVQYCGNGNEYAPICKSPPRLGFDVVYSVLVS